MCAGSEALTALATEHETAARSSHLVCVAVAWQFATQPVSNADDKGGSGRPRIYEDEEDAEILREFAKQKSPRKIARAGIIPSGIFQTLK
jgi:hypothetical protein